MNSSRKGIVLAGGAGTRLHELGFRAETTVADGLARTVDWYLANEAWWRPIRSGTHRDWIELHYGAAT